jgi:cytochrome oxidase Cu insertion factor (SCO1/SenC/PrrC family)
MSKRVEQCPGSKNPTRGQANPQLVQEVLKKELGQREYSTTEEEWPMLNVGDKAPDFTLPSDSGEDIRLKDLLDRTLVLYFFPKADTPG